MILNKARKEKLAKTTAKTTKLSAEAKKVRLAVKSSSGCTWG